MKFHGTIPFASALLLLPGQAPTTPPMLPPAAVAPAAGAAAQGAPAPAAPMAAAPAMDPAAQGPAMVHGTAQAINYRLLESSTRIGFQGTSLLPDGKGLAKVKTKAGLTTIKAKFENLPAPNSFGEACLTYVLWAVSPEGQARNLGELQVKHGKSKIKVTEQLPAFGLLVTAEPYFAVTRPSDAVVLENTVGKETKGKVELMQAKLDLVPQRQYARELAAAPALPSSPKESASMLQARQAVRIAQGAGAENYAAAPLEQAVNYLHQSETSTADAKTVVMTARSATQSGEEARAMAVLGVQAEAVESARKLAQARIDQAQAEAAQAAQASAESAREAQLTTKENADLRAKLLAQLNGILETRATARGLIVNMSGVLFKTGKATVLPAAREKLAKIAGVLATHKGLRIEADGFTDSTGTSDFNARLSEDRARAVQDFLVSQGVPAEAIMSRGFGQDHPIASNDSETGRQENRRVELVLTGEGLSGPQS